jgi:hypothetical protein
MIRKFLIIADRISLASTRRDSFKANAPLFELQIPIEDFWKIEAQLKEYDVMFAAGEDDMMLEQTNHKILKSLVPFVVDEKERAVLVARLAQK